MGIHSVVQRLKHLTSIPTVAAGETGLYAKTGGGLYIKNGTTESLIGDSDIRTFTAPLKAQGEELREQFWTMPDGVPPTTAETRQTMTNFAPSNVTPAASAPYVRSGFLSTTTPNSSEGGSYRVAQLSGPVVSCGARFAFTSYTAGGGLLCLSIQETNIATNTMVPRSPMHFYITPTDWSLDVNDTAGTAVETVASGVLSSPLTANGTTLYTVQIVLDKDRQQCHILFPDGQIRTFTDSRFALPGNFVYVEPFKTLGTPTAKTNALVREWWADSRNIAKVAEYRAHQILKDTSPVVAGGWWGPPYGSGGWVPFGGTHQYPQRRKVGDVVQFRGLAKGGVSTSPAFTMESNYRPPADLFFPSVAAGSAAQILVESNGNIYLTGSATWFALNFQYSTVG